MSSRLSVLSNLQEYTDATTAGNDALKCSIWQITKLRRKQNRGMITMEDTFSAEQIREELRARTLVQRHENMEPELLSEEASPPSPSLDKIPAGWTLVDVIEEMTANKEKPSSNLAISSSVDVGLRQRKSKPQKLKNESSDTNKMTEDAVVDEEEELLKRDALELFSGVRPNDLKKAQKSAKEALEFYVQAASRAAQIISELNAATEESKR